MGGYREWDMTHEAKFTPGPWDYCKPHKRWLVYPESARDGGIDYYIAEAINVDGRFAEAKANAHLIAAAPEMYAALKEIEWIFEGKEDITDSGGPNDAMRACETVRAALRKARGEQ